MNEQMEYTHIPSLGKVSRIGLGTWAIGGWMWGGTDEKKAVDTIHRALDCGINLIDTAPAYGMGISEEIIGKALKEYRKRANILIATKVGINWNNGQVFRDARKERIRKEIEDSLRRLEVDTIDLYQVHWPDVATPFEETALALRTLLDQGKIRAVGVSNFSIAQMEEFSRSVPIVSLQSPYNLFERGIEKEELPYCLKQGYSVLGYGPLCRGLLSGKMSVESRFTGDDLRKIDPKFQEPRYSRYLECVDLLKKWLGQHHSDRPLLALALRYVLDKGVSIALWGGRKPHQFDLFDKVWGWKLSSEDLAHIEEIVIKTIREPIGPQFMAPPFRQKIQI